MRFILIVATLFCYISSSAQNFNLELVSHTEFPSNGNDIWGFVDSDGVEYAIVGSQASSLVYDLSDPSNPLLIKEVPGAFGTWRDFKHVGNYVYGTADQGTDGLLVIDMSSPKDSIPHAFFRVPYDTGSGARILEKVHNLYADDRYVYLSGFDNRGGVLILDTEVDPWQPPVVGFVDDDYSHDVYVQDNLMYTCEIYRGEFAVYDITDVSNPIRLARQSTTTSFTHNAWLSEDGRYLFTTDERTNANVDAYDLNDLNAIKRLDAFKPYRPGASPTIPHNTHYYNGYLVTSWYEDGVIITDAHKPDNLVEVAAYDTRTAPSSGSFNGCWGAYPYLPSGLLLVNDINTGFYVLEPNYTRAAYLEGLVLDSLTKEPINNASIEILSNQPNLDVSNQMGVFKTGQEAEGTFEVRISHPDYNQKIVSVSLQKAQVTDIVVELTQSFKPGKVVDAGSQDNLANSTVTFINIATQDITYATADQNGDFSVLIDGASTYNVYANKWGYKGAVLENVRFDNGAPIQIELEAGYADDFFSDLGWQVTGDASTGNWELGVPNGTIRQGEFLNPNVDTEGDLGPSAYITGNRGTNQGDDDIDDGETILTSPPMDFSADNIESVRLQFNYWYFTCCGNAPVDDELNIYVTNGVETILVDRITASASEWRDWEYELVAEELELTDSVRLIVNASDLGEGHIVEAGIDAFRAEAELILGTNLVELERLSVAPNPFLDQVNLDFGQTVKGNLQVFDIVGNLIAEQVVNDQMATLQAGDWIPGIYYIRLLSKGSVSQTISVVKQ